MKPSVHYWGVTKVLSYKQMLMTVFCVVINWNHFVVLNVLCLDFAGYGKGPGLTGVSLKPPIYSWLS